MNVSLSAALGEPDADAEFHFDPARTIDDRVDLVRLLTGRQKVADLAEVRVLFGRDLPLRIDRERDARRRNEFEILEAVCTPCRRSD